MPREVRFIETESRVVVVGQKEGRNGELLSMGIEFQLGDDEKGLEMDGGNSRTTIWLCLMAPNCTPNMQVAHFMLGIFYNSKKRKSHMEMGHLNL